MGAVAISASAPIQLMIIGACIAYVWSS